MTDTHRWSVLAMGLVLGLGAWLVPDLARSAPPERTREADVSEKAQAEGFEDQVEAERDDHVRQAVDASKKRATPTPSR